MSKITFVTERQSTHLKSALALTGSAGFMSDAIAIAAYRTADDESLSNLLNVAVFECFRGGRAELHVGTSDGHRMSLEVIQALTFIAFHPRHLNLEHLVARIPCWNVNAICTLLKIGFQIEYRDRASVVGGGDGIVLSLARADALASAGPAEQNDHPQVGETQE